MPSAESSVVPVLAPHEVDASVAKPRCLGCVRALVVLDVLLVFAVFLAFAGRPVPDTNEAHYLTKAKHFWEPRWILGDQFLDSADSHVVFYSTFGALTKYVSLERAAWISRLAIWLLTAIGWRRLSQNFAPGFGWAALTAGAALALNTNLHMSGEWFVGGSEAKGVAYACVFWGLADITAGRWNRGFIALGIASAFHVLVGGWSVAASLFILLGDRNHRPAARHCLWGLLAGGAIALAGVVPGLLLGRGVEPEAAAIANRVYVFERLSHHLWAVAFFTRFGARQLALWGVWGFICGASPAEGPQRRLRWFTLASILVATAGLGISYASPQPTDWAAALLKFYWFRLADVAVAVAVSLELATLAVALARSPIVRYGLIALFVGATGWTATEWTRFPADGVPRGEMAIDGPTLPYWVDICGWIDRELPADAVVLAPRVYTTFKWHARRAEFANWKDIPQDAQALVEWQTRLQDLYDVDGRWVNWMPHQRIDEVCRKYGLTHIVTYLEPTLPYPIVYQNDVYCVYRVEQP